jgi:hypothetical protein
MQSQFPTFLTRAAFRRRETRAFQSVSITCFYYIADFLPSLTGEGLYRVIHIIKRNIKVKLVGTVANQLNLLSLENVIPKQFLMFLESFFCARDSRSLTGFH